MLMRRVEVKVVGDGDEEMQIETVGEGKKMSRLPFVQSSSRHSVAIVTLCYGPNTY